MMSSASNPDFRATLRRQHSSQRQSAAPALSSSASMYGLSIQNQQQQQQQLAVSTPQGAGAVVPADARASDPTFEPLERAGRFVNDGIRKDNSFPELDNLVQRMIAGSDDKADCPEGASSNYQLPEDSSWFPFQRTQILTIPDAIFAQYNSTVLCGRKSNDRNTINDANGTVPGDSKGVYNSRQ
jgi:hypothetical protein